MSTSSRSQRAGAVRRALLTLGALALLLPLLVPPGAGAAPTGGVVMDGFGDVAEGAAVTGTIHLSVDDRVGLGRDHPLQLVLRLTRDGNPVPDSDLSITVEGDEPATVTTDASGTAVLDAPLALDDGSALLEEGITVALGTTLPPGRYSLSSRLVDWEDRVRRRAGTTRVTTAVAAAEAAFGPGTPTVFLATADRFPDALAGGAAAAAAGAPILLTASGSLPEATRDQLVRLAPDTVVVLGGPAAISEAVTDQVRQLGPAVVRRWGPSRIDTAVAVSQAGWEGGADMAVVAAADRFADALTGGAVAAREGAPVLLVHADAVPRRCSTSSAGSAPTGSCWSAARRCCRRRWRRSSTGSAPSSCDGPAPTATRRRPPRPGRSPRGPGVCW